MQPTPACLNGKTTAAVIGGQWGDESKGKVVDFLSDWAEIIARVFGGPNAGHTITLNGERYAFHLIPSGILHDKDGKINVITRNTAQDLTILVDELETLHARGYSSNHLHISKDARLILPQHIVADHLSELLKGEKIDIGTTKRGVGPCFTDHVARPGLVVNDVLNPDVFRAKLIDDLVLHQRLFATFDPANIRTIMHDERLQHGVFYHADRLFDIDAMVDYYRALGQKLHRYITDTDELLQQADRQGKRELIEGAQGALLDVDLGTRPCVTSSKTVAEALAIGTGLLRPIDLIITVFKAYQTRVGAGPMPTELGGAESEQFCAVTKREQELERYPEASINDPNPLVQGVALRRIGNEYGTTAGRLRRVGWLDLPLMRKVLAHNGNVIALGLLDVLDTCEQIPLAVAHRYVGPQHYEGQKLLHPGDRLPVAITDSHVLRQCEPQYEILPGWRTPTSDIRHFSDLPENCQQYIRHIVRNTGAEPFMLSVGPERSQSIIF